MMNIGLFKERHTCQVVFEKLVVVSSTVVDDSIFERAIVTGTEGEEVEHCSRPRCHD